MINIFLQAEVKKMCFHLSFLCSIMTAGAVTTALESYTDTSKWELSLCCYSCCD